MHLSKTELQRAHWLRIMHDDNSKCRGLPVHYVQQWTIAWKYAHNNLTYELDILLVIQHQKSIWDWYPRTKHHLTSNSRKVTQYLWWKGWFILRGIPTAPLVAKNACIFITDWSSYLMEKLQSVHAFLHNWSYCIIKHCGQNLMILYLSKQRPSIPDTCDPHLADLIMCCWTQDAKVYHYG